MFLSSSLRLMLLFQGHVPYQYFTLTELPPGLSSVGRVPDSAERGGRGFEHRPDEPSGSLNN